MHKVILLAFFALGCVHGSPAANQYFETVLNNVFPTEARYSQLDPAILPNFTAEFQDKVLGVKVKGQADFFSGRLTGLSNAKRYSECQGPSYSYGQKIYNCTIGFRNLQASYSGKMKYGKMPKVNIKGASNITDVTVLLEVSQNPPMAAVLKNFLIKQAGVQKVKFTGLGPLNKYVKFLEKKYTPHVQAELFNIMSQKVKYSLARAISQVPLPM